MKKIALWAWLSAGCLVFAACGGDPVEPDLDGGGGSGGTLVETLEVEPSHLLVGVAEERGLIVRALDAEGEEVDVPIYFRSADPEVALVSDSGLVGGRAKGQTLIEVEAGRKFATVAVTVEGAAAVLELPPDLELLVGESFQPEIVFEDADGSALTQSRIAWSTDAPDVARFRDGRIEARGWGEARLRASAGAVEATIFVRTLLRFAEIGVGERHTCGRTPAGTVHCWGSGESGELGFEAEEANVFTPSEPVGGGARFEALAVGARHACGLDEEGQVHCWGQNDEEQLGAHRVAFSAQPLGILELPPLSGISASGGMTCGVTEKGDAHCWGGSLVAPEAIEGFGFVGIAVGARHACGLDESGRAFCWGANEAGQLGASPDTLSSSQEPVLVDDVPALETLMSGEEHVCGIAAADGLIHCWGSNTSGELGRGYVSEHGAPDQTANGFPFQSVGLGGGTSCAITESAGAYCWGANQYGQSGDGSEEEILQEPTRMVAGTWTFREIAPGENHSCALSEQGEAYCWGDGRHGQIGGPGCEADGICRIPQLVIGQR